MSDPLSDQEFTDLMTRMGAVAPPEPALAPETFVGYVTRSGSVWHLEPDCVRGASAIRFTPDTPIEQAKDGTCRVPRPGPDGEPIAVTLQPCGRCVARPQCLQCRTRYGERGQSNLGYTRSFCSDACQIAYEAHQEQRRQQAERERQAAEAARRQPFLEAAKDGIHGLITTPKGRRYHRPECENLQRNALSAEPLLSLRVMRWDEEAQKRIPITLTPCAVCKPDAVEVATETETETEP